MVAELKSDGRPEPNYALDWWRSVENSSVVDLCKRRLSLAPLLLDDSKRLLRDTGSFCVCRATIRGRWVPGRYSSASSGFFRDRDVVRGVQLGFAQIKSPLKQARFITSRDQAVKELAEDIAIVLES